MWRVFEPVHDVVYFSAEPIAAAKDIGLRGFWMGYFAFRAAPLGPVGPDPVAAAFHGFPTAQVRRALPDAWSYVSVEECLAARARGTAAALRRVWSSVPDVASADRLAEAADLAWSAAQAAGCDGRVVAAANRALDRPSDPVETLWQATTTLREHRGDGHVAVLLTRGITSVQAHVLKVAAGESDAEQLRQARRFADEDWVRAVDELRERRLVDADGRLTAAGRAERDAVESATDELAVGPWDAIGAETTDRLHALLAPLAEAVGSSGDLPPRNPVGVGRR